MLTLRELIQDLHALEARMRSYERKYGITSADFYQLYQQGILDDEGFEQSTEFTRWASSYTLKLKREAASGSVMLSENGVGVNNPGISEDYGIVYTLA